MLKNVLFLLTLLVVVACVAGCVSKDLQEMTFNPKARLKGIGYDYKSEASLISSKAPTRTTIVYRDAFPDSTVSPNIYKGGQKPDGRIHFLAEPSPDVVLQVSDSIALLIKAKYEKKITNRAFEASLGLIRAHTELAKTLTRRSQGVVYFRDAAYRLAEARLNGISTDEMYDAHMRKLLTLTSSLIDNEIPYIHTSEEENVDPNELARSSIRAIEAELIQAIRNQFREYPNTATTDPNTVTTDPNAVTTDPNDKSSNVKVKR